MKFASPENAWFFLSLPLLLLLMYLAFRTRESRLKKLSSVKLRPILISRRSPFLFWLRTLLMLGVLFFLTLALIRPQWGKEMQWVERKGLDLMVLVDISKSMWAQDIAPSRLVRARHELSSFLENLKGDRVGLTAFAGETQTLCPLSIDYSAVRMFLDALDPQTIEPGTNVGMAIDRTLNMFEDVNAQSSKYQVILLLSDGEEHDAKALEMARKANEQGVNIYTVGIGSLEGVPISIPGRENTYLKDREGKVVHTKLNEQLLESIAQLSGGKYYHASGPKFQLERVLLDLEERERRELEGQQYEQYKERFQIPLGLALVLLLTESFAVFLRRKSL